MTPGIRRLLTACFLALLASLPLVGLHASVQAPTWPARVDRQSQEGDVVTIAFQATPPSGQTVSYSATGLPRGLSISSTTGLVSGTLATSDAGTVNTNGSAGRHTVTLTALGSGGQSASYVFEWRVSRFRRGDLFAGVGNGKYRVFSEEGVFKYELTTDRAEDFVDHTGYNYGWYQGTTTGCVYNWVTRKMVFTSFDDDYDPSLSEIDPVPASTLPASAFPYNRISTFRDSGLEKGGAATGRPIDGSPESVIVGTDFGPDGVLGTTDDIPGVMYVSHAGGYFNANEMPADQNERPVHRTPDFLSYFYLDAAGNDLRDINNNSIKARLGVSIDGRLERWPGQLVQGPSGPVSALIQWGRDIQKFVPGGPGGWTRVAPGENPLVEGFDAHASWQGTDWMDIASDQRTIFYSSEWGYIHRYDVGPGVPDAERQLSPYVTLLPGNMSNPAPRVVYALRLLPPGDGSGGMLIAEPHSLARINEAGQRLNLYDAPGEDGWFALNISPDGRSVWSASTQSGRIYKWDISKGELYNFPNGIGRNGIVSGAGLDGSGNYTLDGLCVMGEYTAAQEVCGDGIDNDEDGEIDEICQPLEACSALSPGDDDGDGLVDTNDPDCPQTVNVCALTGYTDPSIAGYCARFNREGDTVSLLPAPGPPGQSGHYERYVVEGLPAGITAAANGTLSGTPRYTLVLNDESPDTNDYIVEYQVERRNISDNSLVAAYEQSFRWTIQNVNRPPVTLTQTRTIRPGQVATFTVPAQAGGTGTEPCAVDPDCEDRVTLVAGANPGVGTMAVVGTTHTWTPPSNTFTGTVTYTYTRTDPYGLTAPVTLTINVINTPPVANPDAAGTRPGVAVAIPVLTNDTDADVQPTPGAPDTLTITANTNPANGTVTRAVGSGTFVYTPNPGFIGTDTFTYTITDGYNVFSTATVTIVITNRAPIAVDDAVSAIAGYPTASFNVLTLGPVVDSDPDGDSFSITAVTNPSNGTIARTGNSFVYTPGPGFTGVDTFTYTITDVYGLSDTATVTITVRNQPPVAVNDSGTTSGTRPVTIAVMTNDRDPDNHVISVTGATTPSNGSVVVNANGTITYTANPGFQGTDTFYYTIIDGYGGQSTAMVTITIGPPNRFDPCLCSSATASPGEIWPPNHKQTQVVTIANLADPNGGTLAIKILGIYQDEPTNYLGDGDTTIDAGGVGTSQAWVRAERTGNPNVPGNGRVYEIVFEATAADGSTCKGSVFTGVPHDQGNGNTIIDDGIRYDSTVAGGPIVRTALKVESGLTDAQVAERGFALKYVGEARIGGSGTGTANKELIIGSSVGSASDTEDFTWTSGQQALFWLTKTGDNVEFKLITSSQTQAVTFTADCANGECDDIFIRAQAGGTGKITLSSININGLGVADTLTIPVGGSARSLRLSGLSLGEGMSLTGVAKIEWTGTRPAGDTVNFRVQVGSACPTDGGNGGGGGETPPVARSDSYSTDEDTPLVVEPATGILLNDLTFAGPLSAELISTTSNGTLSLNANGTFTYTPAPNFNGQDTFRYRVSDGSLWSEPALVTITVNPAGDPPIAVDDSATTNENTPVSIVVLGNDTDPFGAQLAITALTQPSNGTAAVSGSQIVYTPRTGFLGVDTFTYTITGTEGTDTATVTVTVANVNEPPVAVNNSYTTAEDTPLTVAAPGILANDSDPDAGDTLTSILVTGPSNGTLTLNANGSFVYTPALNFSGADSYTYRVRDSGGLESNIATVSITIPAVNDPPVAVDDSYVVAEDSALQINAPGVRSNDSDPDTPVGDLTISLVTGAQRGSLTLNPDGSFLYTPFPDVTGSDTFTYRISDGTGSDTALVTIAIPESPDPPVAVDDAATTPEDTPVTIPVLGNDSDPDTATLTIQAITQGANGTVAISGNQIVYTPAPGFSGQDVFTYTITDGQATATATVRVTITAVNDPPVALPDAYATPRNVTLTVPGPGVLVNDSDPDSASLSSIGASVPTSGTVVLNPNGSFVYTPATGFTGVATFTYRANDGTTDSNTTTVTVTITGANAPPVAVDDSASTNKGEAVTIAVITNDSDPDGDVISVTANTNPSNGTVTRSGNTFVYTPNATFTGTDTFTYTIRDAGGATATATVTITVSQVCDATSAPAALVRKTTMFDAGSRVEGSIQVIGAYNATFNSNAVYQGDLYMLGTPSITLNGTPAAYGGTINGSGSSSPTSHNVTINAGASLGRIVRRTNAVSMPSVSNPPSPSGTRSVVMNSASDSPGAFSTLRNLTLNSNVGAVTVPAGTYGDFIAGPNSSFVIGTPGATSPSVYNFQNLTLNAATSRLTVVGPVVVTVRYGATWHGNMGSQARPDWLTLMVASNQVQLDSQMSLYGYLVAPNSTFIVNSGTLMRGGFAVDSLIVNSNGRVDLLPLGCVENGPPVAQNDAYTTPQDTPLTVAVPGVLANDSDPEGSSLTASIVSQPSNGTVTLNGTGSFTYTPAAGYSGTDTYTYRVSDGQYYSSAATVTITITDRPDPPVAVDDTATTPEDTPVTINVLGNDTDPDTQTLTLQSITQPANGTAAIVSGQVRFTPAANFTGTTTFTYVVSDGTATDTGLVTVTVTGVNDPPVAANDAYTTAQNTVLNGSTVLVNDTDPDSQSLTAQIVSQPATGTGTVVLQPNGTFAYTPANNFIGTATFTYRVSDGTATSNIATVTIVVTAANRPPVAVNDAYSTDKNVPLTIAVPGILVNDSDPDAGNTITAALVTGTAASTGTVTLNANGSFTFTPANNYHGTTTFTYRAVDNQGALSNVATVTITIKNVANSGRVCYDGGAGKTQYRTQLDWERLASGDIKARATVSRNYTDNSYGVNKVGWGNKNRDFKAVYLSDYGQLAFYDANGVKKIDFKIDLLSPSPGTPSGWGTRGVTSAQWTDGGMISGSASDILSMSTSMDLNMNAFGYVTTAANHPLKSYSPATNSNYTPNATYPLWIFDVWYEATIKASAFGSSGFGTVTLRGLHASPPKADVTTWRLVNCQ